MSDLTTIVTELERGFWTESDDPDYFTQNVAEEGFAVIEPMGVIEKRGIVEMAADEPWRDVEMTDLVVREVTPDVAVIAYHGQGRHAGDAEPHRSSIVSTYVRRQGRWLLAMTAHQPWTEKQEGTSAGSGQTSSLS